MKTIYKIYKHKLELTDKQVLTLPAEAEILSVTNQHEKIVMYAKFNTNMRGLRNQTIYIYGTGHEITAENLTFIGTVVLHSGRLVFHVFID